MPPLKQKLSAGKPVVVVNPDHPHAGLVEYLGKLPVDAVFIDCEQGSADVETVEHLARAARCAGIASLVRLYSREDWAIERYLGRGVDGIVVPRLDTAAQAAAVVEAVRYCYPRTFAEKVVVAQIETKAALETLGDFLRVDGIDVFFIGPVDLAKSMGRQGDYRHPEVQRAMEQAVGTIRGAGKAAGILVDQHSIGPYCRMGVQFLYCHVNLFLDLGAAQLHALTRTG